MFDCIPDYDPPGAFQRYWGGRQSDLECAWETFSHKINEVISQAYREYPVTSAERRKLISAVLTKAAQAITPHIEMLSAKDTDFLLDAYTRIMKADMNHDVDSVREEAGDIMDLYRRKIEEEAV